MKVITLAWQHLDNKDDPSALNKEQMCWNWKWYLLYITLKITVFFLLTIMWSWIFHCGEIVRRKKSFINMSTNLDFSKLESHNWCFVFFFLNLDQYGGFSDCYLYKSFLTLFANGPSPTEQSEAKLQGSFSSEKKNPNTGSKLQHLNSMVFS